MTHYERVLPVCRKACRGDIQEPVRRRQEIGRFAFRLPKRAMSRQRQPRIVAMAIDDA